MISALRLGLGALIVWVAAVPAAAHTVSGRLVETKPAVVEFRYSTGEAMSYAEVTVTGPGAGATATSEVHQTGRTDGDGRFAFIPKRRGHWFVEAVDEERHKARFDLDVTEAMTVRRTNERLIEILLFASVLLNVLAGYMYWQQRAHS